ncbi:hypothetical protein EMIT0194MI4_90026 [Pseudomonas sp. IT-194MI4]
MYLIHFSPNTYSVRLKFLTKVSEALRALLTQHSETRKTLTYFLEASDIILLFACKRVG